MIDSSLWRKLIQTPNKSILSLHTKPDGDSIGSNLAMLQILKQFGHEVTVVARDQPGKDFAFLPGFDHIKLIHPKEFDWIEYDTFWALDISAPSMVDEDWVAPAGLTVATIDHHASNSGWGTYNLVEPDAISATEVLFHLLVSLKIDIAQPVAQCLMTGLATDSGFFEYADKPEDFVTATRLLELGADYGAIRYHLRQHVNLELLQQSMGLLECAQHYHDPSMVVFPIANQVVQKFHLTQPPHLIVDNASRITGTDFGVVMFETTPQAWRLEFRSRTPGYDVSEIAKQLGGGGHVAAAGVRQINGTQAEIIDKIKQAAMAKTMKKAEQ